MDPHRVGQLRSADALSKARVVLDALGDTRLAAHALNSETGLTPQQIWLFSYDAEKAAMGTDDEWRALREW